jgi:predicted dehydrogenase
MLKVALVGCGKIADAHVEEIQKLPCAQLIAVCDAEPLMAEQLATRYGVSKRFADFKEMLGETAADVVHITTPPHSHVALARQALDAGCHVFVEKPLALTSADARALLAQAEGVRRQVTTGWLANFDPAAMAMRETVRRGVIGEPVHLVSIYGYDLSGPFGPSFLSNQEHWVNRLPGKLFHNVIDHLLNKLPEFIADDSPCIIAEAHGFSAASRNGAMLDELRVMIRGKRVTASAVFSANIKPTAHSLEIYGTRNTMRVDYVARTATLAAAPRMPSAIGRLLPPFSQGAAFWREGLLNVKRFLRSDFHYFAGLNLLIERFYRSILDGTPPPIDYRDIVWVTNCAEEIFRQIAVPGTSTSNAPRELVCAS